MCILLNWIERFTCQIGRSSQMSWFLIKVHHTVDPWIAFPVDSFFPYITHVDNAQSPFPIIPLTQNTSLFSRTLSLTQMYLPRVGSLRPLGISGLPPLKRVFGFIPIRSESGSAKGKKIRSWTLRHKHTQTIGFLVWCLCVCVSWGGFSWWEYFPRKS